MNSVFTRFFFIILLTGLSICSPQCYGQVGVDTTFNSITRDSTGRKAPVAGTWQTVNLDSTRARNAIPDTVKPKPRQPNPKKAGLYSALIPGIGQVYNREYWKVPVIYVGITIAGYFISNNLTKYHSYRKAYINRLNNPNYIDEYTPLYNPSEILVNMQQLQNQYNKYLDLAVLFTGIGYALQVLDAITSAHLKNFDISRDISFHMKPVAVPNGAGLALVVNFR